MSFYEAMYGLGDTLYTRPVVRELTKRVGPIHLMTSWPQLFADLPVSCVKPFTKLRTQRKNMDRPDLKWADFPNSPMIGRIAYDGHAPMLASMLHSVGLYPEAVDFSGPPLTRRIVKRRPYILVRPGTVRSEWVATARNPRPEYLCRVVNALRSDYDIVSVADLAGTMEYAVEPLPYADEAYHGGELPIESLLALVAGASGVVGGVGWLFPAAVAYQVPMLLLYGGWGHVNGPAHITDPRMPLNRVVQAMPERFCMCNDRLHNCDKEIEALPAHIERFRNLMKAADAPEDR